MDNKYKILFVDDESRILSGLKRALRPMHTQWDMSFAEGGQKAIELVDETDFDVVITDMRMPEIDGEALLTYVKDKCPDAVRIILSGYTEIESALKTISVAHQFLTKPCEVETLTNIITRACQLQSILPKQTLRKQLGGIDQLPSLPKIYQDLSECLKDPEVEINTVVDIISKDIAISAKILKIVNSGFFGVKRHIISLETATKLLGINMIKKLTFSTAVFQSFCDHMEEFSLDTLMSDSLNVANIASAIVLEASDKDDAFIAGMLHHVGYLIAVNILKDDFTKALTEAKEKSLPLEVVEVDHLQASHAQLGAYLLELWGLPLVIVEAVAFHHEPMRVSKEGFGVVDAVAIAHKIYSCVKEGLDRDELMNDQAFAKYLESLKITEKLPAWLELAEGTIKEEKE